ncbi:hypothetical protein MCOR27_009470 [Pyricularia oryzae]|uniref:Dolichyl-diphosphooligosaccharide--protein glycosyltransferase subunit WBP1 n=2 Tax=Pyricularia TaxID=48558 RepID=A0ABQ8NDI4_PYRGI|nr:hypothetical protein MCOR01_009802 [Pyricularia oryzae]KAI6295314.1 hypothetical protein MCOR33_007762 [Pyricularia grisea]KAH9436900.1 hypothetical protein MCOR02_000564 [Pyricularia oryzae]KAI6260770.1 hypothetical protein MCOR19_002986 [Pyricularia oryzae]KAI6270080.1 hypothetical protein MCOR27_009470 [Pyricularia oryzae]
MFKPILSLLFLLLAATVSAVSSSGNRLLAVLEDVAEKEKYSKFMGDLQSRGFSITYSTPKSDSLKLSHLGERVFDHVIIFPTKSKGLGPNLTPALLLQFVKDEGNVMLVLSAETAVPISIVSLLHELDIQLPADRTGLVVDHFNYDKISAAEKHDVILVKPRPVRDFHKDIFGSEKQTSQLLAVPRAIGQTLGQSPLLNTVLRAPLTAYSYDPKEQSEVVDDLFAAGEQLSLVSAVQPRNSARVAVVGSAEMLQDQWFDAEVKSSRSIKKVSTYNREFAKKLSGWTFQEYGVLRVNSVEHHLSEAGASNVSNPAIYRVKNDVTYTISLSEYKPETQSWGPFTVPDGDEIQLEFSMLSPFYRLGLKPTTSTESDATKYSVSFTLPDQHGIFNFRVNYKRPFLTYIDSKDQVSVRHMAHDEWPRSYVISGAWPWITGIGATVTGFLAFCLVFMFSAPTGKATVTKKTQ